MAGQLKASWGVNMASGGVAGVSGVVTDFEKSVEPVSAPLNSESGSDIGHTVYDVKTSVSATVLCKSEARLPNPGDVIAIGDNKYYVDRAAITENNQSYTKFSVSGSRYSFVPNAVPDIRP